MDLKFIDSILEKYDSDKTKIIAIMQDVQEKYRYLPQEALEYIAKKVERVEALRRGDILRQLLAGRQGQVRHEGLPRHGMSCAQEL